MQKPEIKLYIFLILFLLFSPISTHAISLDGENLLDNSENKIIGDARAIESNLTFFKQNKIQTVTINSTKLPF